LIPDFQALKAYPNHIETKGSSNIETMDFDQRKLFPGENGRKKPENIIHHHLPGCKKPKRQQMHGNCYG